MHLRKIDGDLGDPDGQMVMKYELEKQFEEGVPMQLGSPDWSSL